MIGHRVPGEDSVWSILMDLKDMVELVMCQTFDEESIECLKTKIHDHRQMLQELFPDF